MPVKIALDVPEDHSYVAMVRRICRALLEHHRTAAQDVDDIEAVVGELCSNVTRHASSVKGQFCVTLEHLGERVVLVVVDEGRGFDPRGISPVGTPRPDMDGDQRYGGFGLHLVRTLTDRLDIGPTHPFGTTVRAEKHLRPPDRMSTPVE